jgi:hypothetical protein
MIVGVPAVPVTDPDDLRLANFRGLTAGDRRLGTAQTSGPPVRAK